MRRAGPLLALVLAHLFALASARRAHAQACCAGPSALTPARVPQSEWLVAGAQAFARPNMGEWNAHGTYVARPPGAAELDAELDVYAGWRTPWRRLQIAAFVPAVLTARAAGGTSAVGGGVGDMNFAVRLEALDDDRFRWLPGVAVLAGLTAPTGTPPESASRPLAVDATGAGSVRGTAGLGFEKPIGPWLLDAFVLTTLYAPRSIGAVEEVRAPGLVLTGAAAYVLGAGEALGASLAYEVEWDVTVGGAAAKDSSRRALRLALFGVHPFGRGAWRVLGSLAVEPPVSGLGQNESVSATLLLGVQRGFE